MEKLSSAIKSMKFLELVLMGLTFMAVVIKCLYGYNPNFFLLIFTIGLTLVYCPFGFYFLGRPSANYTYTISIILGLIYALGVLTLILTAVNIDSYRYPLMGDFFVLTGLIIFLLYQLKKNTYPNTYVNAQFIRIAFIILTSFIILFR